MLAIYSIVISSTTQSILLSQLLKYDDWPYARVKLCLGADSSLEPIDGACCGSTLPYFGSILAGLRLPYPQQHCSGIRDTWQRVTDYTNSCTSLQNCTGRIIASSTAMIHPSSSHPGSKTACVCVGRTKAFRVQSERHFRHC